MPVSFEPPLPHRHQPLPEPDPRPASGGPRHAEEERLQRIAGAGEPGAGSEARLRLGRLFRRHPESSRTIAVLHYLDGLTLEQVAEVVGLSVSGVRRRLRRLRHDLVDLENP